VSSKSARRSFQSAKVAKAVDAKSKASGGNADKLELDVVIVVVVGGNGMTTMMTMRMTLKLQPSGGL
jgi:hypothetical protein